MLKLFNYLILLLLSLLLCGCLFGKNGYIHNRKNVYLASKNLPKIKLPANLHSAKIESAYPIADGEFVKQRTAPSLLPPGNNWQLTTTQQTQLNTIGMKIVQGSDGFPVLRIPTDYPVVWRTIVKLLPQAGYQIIGSDMKTGVIEVRIPIKQGQTAGVYQFSVLQHPASTSVRVLDQVGQKVPSSTSKPMLQSLSQQLKKDHV